MRDIYLIPVARGISGKLILAEKHPFRSQRGVVIAISPLAGLSVSQDVVEFFFFKCCDFNEGFKEMFWYWCDHLGMFLSNPNDKYNQQINTCLSWLSSKMS